jgi:peptidyl-prolyl cis-trans isomerase C
MARLNRMTSVPPRFFQGLRLPALVGIALVATAQMAVAQVTGPPGASGQTRSGTTPPGPLPGQGKPAISPVAPGDLSRPVFDTTTRAFGRQTGKSAADAIVAEVEGHPITLGEVGDLVRALPADPTVSPTRDDYAMVLDQLVRRTALAIRAQQTGLDNDAVIKRLVAAAVSDQLAGAYVRRQIASRITEKMLLDRYDSDVANAPPVEEFRVRVIVSPVRKQIEDLLAAMRGGGDFTALARDNSKDSSAKEGGDLGFRNSGQLPPQIAGLVSGLTSGQVVATPVLTPYGWMAVKLDEKRMAPKPSFSAARELLVQRITRELEPSVTNEAMQGLTIRNYGINGREDIADDPDKAPSLNLER